MKYTIEKEDKPRFSWWRDVAEMLFVFVMLAVVVTLGVEAASHDVLGDCTVCVWEMLK